MFWPVPFAAAALVVGAAGGRLRSKRKPRVAARGACTAIGFDLDPCEHALTCRQLPILRWGQRSIPLPAAAPRATGRKQDDAGYDPPPVVADIARTIDHFELDVADHDASIIPCFRVPQQDRGIPSVLQRLACLSQRKPDRAGDFPGELAAGSAVGSILQSRTHHYFCQPIFGDYLKTGFRLSTFLAACPSSGAGSLRPLGRIRSWG